MGGPSDEWLEKYKENLTPLFKHKKEPPLLTDDEISEGIPSFRAAEYHYGFVDGVKWAEEKSEE